MNHHLRDPRLAWLTLRSALALSVVALSGDQSRWVGAAGLVGCVWVDALAGWLARKRNWPRGAFAGPAEMLADFICFVWAPVTWVTARNGGVLVWLAAGVFVLAGAFRLARFAVEGLVGGGYRGLPVTYNGYLVPLAGGLVTTVLPYPAWVWPGVFLGLAALMVSTRFTVPEF
ncbi:MAG: hypothetical protein JNG82_09975 [Opitutaceae bacterium]|nr:hypothetical protein [Opitutaceae bacterium]